MNIRLTTEIMENEDLNLSSDYKSYTTNVYDFNTIFNTTR